VLLLNKLGDDLTNLLVTLFRVKKALLVECGCRAQYGRADEGDAQSCKPVDTAYSGFRQSNLQSAKEVSANPVVG